MGLAEDWLFFVTLNEPFPFPETEAYYLVK